MNDSPLEPVPAITEALATGETARLYADIRAFLKAPVVNLIWRHFATLPGGLDWAWESVRPLYHDGSISVQAAALRASMRAPAPARKLDRRMLAAAGLTSEDLATISMILGSYERTNSMNVIALGALLAGIEGRAGSSGGEGAPVIRDEAVAGEMPVPLALAEMSPEVRSLVERLHHLGPADDIVPTMYRHMSHWPEYLQLVHDVLAPLDSGMNLTQAVDATRDECRARAASLSPRLATPDTKPDVATVRHIQAKLVQFIDGPLAKMVTFVAIIKAAMPGPST